ncbi:MAG: hypothetical protein IPJ88_14705 [Myxococcales bacterium]|nr:MAG: hypothetical protein IPJ88_14705 [Myxococcales bacterium]
MVILHAKFAESSEISVGIVFAPFIAMPFLGRLLALICIGSVACSLAPAKPESNDLGELEGALVGLPFRVDKVTYNGEGSPEDPFDVCEPFRSYVEAKGRENFGEALSNAELVCNEGSCVVRQRFAAQPDKELVQDYGSNEIREELVSADTQTNLQNSAREGYVDSGCLTVNGQHAQSGQQVLLSQIDFAELGESLRQTATLLGAVGLASFSIPDLSWSKVITLLSLAGLAIAAIAIRGLDSWYMMRPQHSSFELLEIGLLAQISNAILQRLRQGELSAAETQLEMIRLELVRQMDATLAEQGNESVEEDELDVFRRFIDGIEYDAKTGRVVSRVDEGPSFDPDPFVWPQDNDHDCLIRIQNKLVELSTVSELQNGEPVLVVCAMYNSTRVMLETYEFDKNGYDAELRWRTLYALPDTNTVPFRAYNVGDLPLKFTITPQLSATTTIAEVGADIESASVEIGAGAELQLLASRKLIGSALVSDLSTMIVTPSGSYAFRAAGNYALLVWDY